jgi:hypothetical protein
VAVVSQHTKHAGSPGCKDVRVLQWFEVMSWAMSHGSTHIADHAYASSSWASWCYLKLLPVFQCLFECDIAAAVPSMYCCYIQ